jgi:DNA-binding LacI/PurR family transcriptional regulator
MATMKDVAAKSGFSIATVSAVINNAPIVSDKAREKILQAIDELGYKPNAIARSLKNARTSSIGIIVRDITSPIYAALVSGMEEAGWANNYEVFLCNTEDDVDRERKYIDNLVSKRVDGVIITTSQIVRKDFYDKLQENNIPYVFLNRKPNELREHEYFVGANNAVASEKVIDYLHRLGYKKIAFICGPQHFSTFRERYVGFLHGMNKYGLSVYDQWVWTSDYKRKAGYEYANQMIENNNLPEIIICSSALLAFGVFLACKEKGVRIPEDVALISLDHNEYDELIDLSSVDLQHRAMGKMAMQILIDQLSRNSFNQRQQQILLEPELVIRKSCGHHLRSGH